MSLELDMLTAIEDTVSEAVSKGMDQQAAIRAGAYVIKRIRDGMIPDKVAAKLCWAAFADGFQTRARLEGKHGGN